MSGVDVDELYGLPLERFLPERTALVKALRAAKRRDEAREIAALRKPSVAAWAVNQVVRTQVRDVGALFAAGDALRAAQEDLLAGDGDPRALRAANDHVRGALSTLTTAARGLMADDGHELSGSVIERVGETLNAAALDEDARAEVRGGRLVRELRHVGFGLGEGAFVAGPPARPSARSRSEAEDEERREHERTQALEAVRSALAAAERRVDEAATGLQQAQADRAEAAGAFEDAQRALTQADSIVERAREEVGEAEHARTVARAELEALE